MTEHTTRFPGDPPGQLPGTGPLSDEAASHLLGLCRHRPVDDLIERLQREDGDRWLASALGAVSHEQRPLIDESLASGALPEALREVKQASKRLVSRRDDDDRRLAGLAGYFIAVAAGLTHHGQMLSSRDPDEVAAVLVDLSAAMPEPWADLLARGARALREPR